MDSIVRQATHGSIGSELHGITGVIAGEQMLNEGPDLLEIYTTLEVLISLGGTDSQDILTEFKHIDIFVKQMFKTFEHTS